MNGTAQLHVVARPHWVNAMVLRLAARPYVRIDGVPHALAWGRARVFTVTAEAHEVETFLRYRGTPWLVGRGSLQFSAQAGEDVFVTARTGPLNHQPLQPRLDADDRATATS